MLRCVEILQIFNVKELRVLHQVSIVALSLHAAQRASVRFTTYHITLADELAVVRLVHTGKIVILLMFLSLILSSEKIMRLC